MPSVIAGRRFSIACPGKPCLPERRPPPTAGFLHPYRIEGGVAAAVLRILLRDFQTAKLEETGANPGKACRAG